MTHLTHHPSPVGLLTLASDGEHLVGLWLADQKYFAAGVDPANCHEDADLPVFGTTRAWLDDYFAGRRPDSTGLPLRPPGSSFRQAVWEALREVPYGRTTTYGTLARSVARRQGRASLSSQAVGGAIGHNPISIIIPCHRVVGSTGSLTGYAGGLDRKLQLLTLEGADLTGLFIPRTATG